MSCQISQKCPVLSCIILLFHLRLTCDYILGENYESWMTSQAEYDDEEVERDEIWLNDSERMQKNVDAHQNQKETLRLQESNSEKIRAYSMKVERCKGKSTRRRTGILRTMHMSLKL